jgi:hypothetical protein
MGRRGDPHTAFIWQLVETLQVEVALKFENSNLPRVTTNPGLPYISVNIIMLSLFY